MSLSGQAVLRKVLHLLPIDDEHGGISSDLDEGQSRQDRSFTESDSRLVVCSFACWFAYSINLSSG